MNPRRRPSQAWQGEPRTDFEFELLKRYPRTGQKRLEKLLGLSSTTIKRLRRGEAVNEETWGNAWKALGMEPPPHPAPLEGGAYESRPDGGAVRESEMSASQGTAQTVADAPLVLASLIGGPLDGVEFVRVGCEGGVLPKGAWFVLHAEARPLVAGAIYAVRWRGAVYVRRAVAEAHGWRFEDAKGQDFPMCRDAPEVLGRVGLVLRAEVA